MTNRILLFVVVVVGLGIHADVLSFVQTHMPFDAIANFAG